MYYVPASRQTRGGALKPSQYLGIASGAATIGSAFAPAAPVLLPTAAVLGGTGAILGALGHGIPKKYVRKRKAAKRKPKRRVRRRK